MWKTQSQYNFQQECEMQSLWKIARSFLKKLKTELALNPAISFLDRYPKELKLSQKDTCIHMVITEFLTPVNSMRTTYVSTNRWINEGY